MPLADRCVEEILDRLLAGQGPMIGGGGGLKCRQVWTTALEQRPHTARTRKMIFIFVRSLEPAGRRRGDGSARQMPAQTATAIMTAVSPGNAIRGGDPARSVGQSSCSARPACWRLLPVGLVAWFGCCRLASWRFAAPRRQMARRRASRWRVLRLPPAHDSAGTVDALSACAETEARAKAAMRTNLRI